MSAIQAALSTDGRPGLQKLLEFPFTYHYSGGFFFNAPPAVKHTNWKSLDAACGAWDRQNERGDDVDESKPMRCPLQLHVDPSDDRPATIVSPQPGSVSITFPSHREVQDVWRLRWVKGSWRLGAIDYE